MAPSHHSAPSWIRLSRRQVQWFFCVVVLLAVGWILVHQAASARSAWEQLQTANFAVLLTAILLFASSLLWASTVYAALLPGRLMFWRTVIVQSAGLFANKLLPAGSGALSTSYLYLRKAKIRQSEAAATVTLNNTLGFVGNSLLVGLWLLLDPSSRQFASLHHYPEASRWGPVVTLLIVVGILLLSRSQRVRHALSAYVRSLKVLLSARRLLPALGASLAITITYAVTLLLSALAVGLHVTFGQSMIALTLGVAAASIVPTPGGIGAAEAGLYGAFRLYGFDAQTALAAAVLYRIATFWIPLVYGAIGLIVARQKRYL